jgi:DNA methylase
MSGRSDSQTWTYEGHGGLNYPCQPGETWSVTDRAILTIGNLVELPPLPAAALAYADPPWNQGNRNSFQTKAHLEHAETPFPVFLDAVLECIQAARCWAIEMGKQNAHILDQLITQRHRIPSEFDVTYYRRHPSKLFIAPAPRLGDQQLGDPTGLDDDDTPLWAITAWTEPNELVVDPVTGRGLTAVTALEMHRRFHGYELSPYRSSVTLTRLAALTGATPERIA